MEYDSAAELVLRDMLKYAEHRDSVGGGTVDTDCIWGIAIHTGHARKRGFYGMGLSESVQEALRQAGRELFGAPRNAGIGRINDAYMFPSGSEEWNPRYVLIRRWIRKAWTLVLLSNDCGDSRSNNHDCSDCRESNIDCRCGNGE